MNDNVGVWIDHEKAIIVSASEDRIGTKTVEAIAVRHTSGVARAMQRVSCVLERRPRHVS